MNGDETILDIGCGDGKNTADVSAFVPEGSVIGVDPSSDMIKWASAQYDPREYPNLKFGIGSLIEPKVQGSFDIVMTLCVMQHCFEHKKAMEKMHSILKPGGKLLILVPANKESNWSAAVKSVCQGPKWSSYWKDYEPRIFLNCDQSKKLLSETNYEILSVENLLTVDPFIDKEDLVAWMMGTYPPLIPKELERSFFSEVIDAYISLSPEAMNEDGTIYVSYSATRVVAKSI
ncbi:MAG: Trans-aconitate 2-methyltransferase [Chlamydiia bacterium]|nr:Trans-aconitate 2-methyltransferase [Chlamydiia bacterium]